MVDEIASNLSLSKLFGVLRRKLGFILTVGIAAAVVFSGLAFAVPRKYTAEALIEVVAPSSFTAQERAVVPVVNQMMIDSHTALLTARDFVVDVEKTLREEKQQRIAVNSPVGRSKYVLARDGAVVTKESNFLQTVEHENGGKKGSVGGSEHEKMKINKFLKNYSVNQYRASQIIIVRFTSTSPQKAAFITNRIVDLYLAKENERKNNRFQLESEKITTRIGKIEKELGKFREKIDASLESHNTEGFRESEEKVRADAESLINLRARQNDLRERMETSDPGVRIVSRAAPPELPSSLSPFLFIFPGTLLAIIGACAGVVVKDQLDRTFRCPESVNRRLGIICGGLVPEIVRSTKSKVDLRNYSKINPSSPFTKAIRNLSVELLMPRDDKLATVVLITSSVPGEGKSTLGANIANYIASLERKVLIIDFDCLSASQSGIQCEVDGSVSPNWNDNNGLGSFVRKMPESNYDYLPIRRLNADGLLLLASGEFKIDLEMIRKSYSLVIIDSVSILGNAEATLLSELADYILFVIKWGETPEDIARSALEQLTMRSTSGAAPSNFARAIINRVKLREWSRFRLAG